MPKPDEIIWWSGPDFWAAFDAQRAEYPGPDARLQVFKQDGKTVTRVCGPTGDGGPPIDDSHVCPPVC